MNQRDVDAIARRLVAANMYMTIATADEHGRPWASPVWYAPTPELELVWVSAPDARHSRNIEARPEVGIVIFDSTVPVGAAEALYVEAVAEQVADAEVAEVIEIYSNRSQACGAPAWVAGDVSGEARLRLYRARPTAQSILGPGDQRLPVSALRQRS